MAKLLRPTQTPPLNIIPSHLPSRHQTTAEAPTQQPSHSPSFQIPTDQEEAVNLTLDHLSLPKQWLHQTLHHHHPRHQHGHHPVAFMPRTNHHALYAAGEAKDISVLNMRLASSAESEI
jgi:hypothetical protein